MKLLDWLEEAEGAPVAAGVSRAALLERAGARMRDPVRSVLRPAGEEIWRWNLGLGADPAQEARWFRALEGEGLVVVAGQQPALLGGPLYSLYKLVTAIVLAEDLERSTGRPCLAVFWVVGDDSDFGEVSAAHLPGRNLRPVKLRDAGAPASGSLVGGLDAARQTALLAAGGAGLADLLEGEKVRGLIEAAAARGRTWSGLQAALFHALLPGRPLIVLDGGHDAVVREQSAWLAATAAALPLAALLREGVAEARTAGFEPALDPELGERALFRIEEGRRVPLAGTARAGDRIAPNVVLRPLLQDRLLPNVATICGPSEVRYRAQLGPVYRAAGVPEPLRLPRLKAALLPALGKGHFPTPDRLGAAYAEPDRFLAEALERSLPQGLAGEVEEARGRIREVVEGLRPGLSAYDPSLGQILDSAAGKIDFQVQRLAEGLAGKARHLLFQEEPRLGAWREFVRPREAEQERVLSLLTPYLEPGGEDPSGVLEQVAREHLARMLDQGRPPATALLLWGAPGVRTEGGSHE